MAAMRSSATVGAGLVQPLPARVAAFRPVSRSQRTSVVAQATSENTQVAQKLAAFGAAASALATAGSAQAADVTAQAVEAVAKANDNRALLLATLFVPALGWVAYNILDPAMSQYRNMRLKGLTAALGLSATSLLLTQQADAANEVAELAAGDNRALILAVIFVPAIGWVAFNILGPALNQLANMASAGGPSKGKGKGGKRR